MDPLVSTLVLILVALLGARISFSTEGVPLGPRLLFRTGTHFVFIGFLLGPQVLGFITSDSVDQLDPLVALALGWVGFLFGLQLDRESLSQFPRRFFLVTGIQAVLCFLVFFGVGWLVLSMTGGAGEVPTLLLAAGAATACTTTPAGIALVSTNFMVRGRIREMLFFIASLDAVIGVTALQIIYSFYHPGELILGAASVSTLGWTVLAVGLAILSAILFLWLVRSRPTSEELVLLLLGISALASGAALQVQISPLFVTALMGAIVANLYPERQRIFGVLQQWEKPIYLVLLLLAGALLRFPTPLIIPLALFYVAARIAGKVIGAGAATLIVRMPFPTPRRVGLGLLPQGGITMAMAVSVVLTYEGLTWQGYSAVELFFSVVVVGVVASELIGPFFATQVLRRAREISPRVEEALEQGDDRRAKEEAIRHTSPSDNQGDARSGEESGPGGGE